MLSEGHMAGESAIIFLDSFSVIFRDENDKEKTQKPSHVPHLSKKLMKINPKSENFNGRKLI